MSKQKSMKEIASTFKSNMQKIVDESDDLTGISMSINGGEYHTIAEKSQSKNTNMKTEEPKKTKQSKQFLKYQFTHDEIHEKGIELARLSSEAIAIENERKAVAAEFKAKIDTKDAEIGVLGNHINNGYEYRYIECTEIFNMPRTGIKTIMRNDTKEKVSEVQMSPDELQSELAFDE